MIYIIEEGKLKEQNTEDGNEETIVIIEREEMEKEVHGNDRLDRIISRVLSNNHLRFECYDELDVMCIHLHTDVHSDTQVAIHIFLQNHCLWIVSEKCYILDKQIMDLMKHDSHDWNLGRVLYASLDSFLEGESQRLDILQEKINELEDEVITDKSGDDTIRKIIELRKRLSKQERDYNSMQDVLDHVCLNRNQLMSDQDLRSFSFMASKVGRLIGRVATLQDYVTEIREAYQASIDIKLNVTMRIFTVITAVFLPLTLLAGWYGMNLKMPEFQSEVAYPLLIVVSILIVMALLVYFKRNKWF